MERMKDIKENPGNHPYSLEELQGYVKGTLDPVLSAKITSDLERYEELTSIIEGIRYFQDREEGSLDAFLADSLRSQAKLIGNPKPGRALSVRWTSRVAAAVVVILMAGLFVIINLLPDKAEADVLALTDDFLAQPYELRSFPTRGNDEAIPSGSWQQAYSSKQWQLAKDRIALLENTSIETIYYKGLCSLYLGEYQDASNLLAQVVELDDSRGYQENARWYLALAYIKSNRYPKARAVLKAISGMEAHFRKSEARELIKLMP